MLAGAADLAGAEETTPAGLRDQLRECRSVEDSLQRLMCFDRLVDGLDEGAPAPQGAGDEGTSGWRLEKATNPLDDTPRVVAGLLSVEGQGRLGGGGPVELYVRCQSGKIEVFVWWREWLGTAAVGGDSVDVTTRFDQGELTTRKWLKSSDGQSTFVPAGAEGFALQLTGHSRLVANVVPIAGNPVMAVFELAGASDAIAEVRTACGR